MFFFSSTESSIGKKRSDNTHMKYYTMIVYIIKKIVNGYSGNWGLKEDLKKNCKKNMICYLQTVYAILHPVATVTTDTTNNTIFIYNILI